MRNRPKLTSRALLRWGRPLARQAPFLVSAYLLPGRVPPRVREAAMLGVTAINRCEACEAVHGRWASRIGLVVDDLAPREAAAHDFGQRLAVSASGTLPPPPPGLSPRHARELLAASLLMELANLAGNRFLAPRPAADLQVGDLRAARLLDLVMRVADRAGVRHARARIAGGARGDVLEIGIGTGSNLRTYQDGVVLHGLDPSAPALSIAGRRARGGGRRVVLVEGDAESLPYPDATFDAVVATFVLCSVGDVGRSLAEARRVLRPGGTIRLLEHARSGHRWVGALQERSAPAWARATGGCRLDHDVLGAVRRAGLRAVETRLHAGGLLVEVVAA
ncbi:MAG TPA: class I SAM-dependent methyltransferase [Candidatus Limnocylindrales bacterium]|nr:class I SAM-dependent methyltransferase [Candidatus Limnocylindrales bacterium]